MAENKKNTPQQGPNRSVKTPMQKKNDRIKSARRAASWASRRNSETADKIIARYDQVSQSIAPVEKKRANQIDDSTRLKIIGLGGMDGAGSKNMLVFEYGNDAIITDVGIDLSVDLPGINFAIPDTTYLESIKKKIRAYVFTHGHLDHIGGAPYIIKKYPAPVYGSRLTIGMVERITENSPATDERFKLDTHIMNPQNHERIKIGPFTIELVHVTHSIPDSTAVVIDTPVGRVINTGDFKIDPEPLDHKNTDIERFKQLGKEGVLALLSESTSTERPGRTAPEVEIQPTFDELIKFAPGRVFVAMFSTNINRVQMVINTAVAQGRKVAMDGRSMLANLETAVRNGYIKIPKGTVIPMGESSKVPDKKLVVICTGSQGEENSALRRMTMGDHKHIKLKAQDTVILSSTPIPTTGNDALVERLVDDAMRIGVHVYQHQTREIDNTGPLHVSGHASREEYGEMVEFCKPKFFIPIYGGFSAKKYHIDVAVETGVIKRENCLNAELGDVIELTPNTMKVVDRVAAGTVLVDNTGAEVSNVVIKDRLLMAQDGIITVILTLKKGSGQLLTSPDIISRGFIYLRESEELMNEIRKEARFFALRKFKGMPLDDFKQNLRDHIAHLLYSRTERSPIVIPVVNVVGGSSPAKPKVANKVELLNQDQAD